jgi:RNase P/RNase MRP subunit p30
MFDLVLNKNLDKYGKEFGFSNIYCVNDFKVVEGKEDNEIRRALENKNTELLYGIEKFRIKDKLQYKDSGLNQVLCKLAKKNNIKIGISFNDVLNSKDTGRAKILGRMVQNVVFCNKYKVDVVVCSFANNMNELRGAKDLVAFGKLLGIREIYNERTDNFFKEKVIGIKRIK